MKQGAYIARIDLDALHLSGVSRKIYAQQAALKSAAFNTTLYALRSGSIVADTDIISPAKNTFLSSRLTHYHYFWQKTANQVKGADFLYIRFQGAGPGLLRLLSTFRYNQPQAPVLLEIPTFPYQNERQGTRGLLLGALDDFYARYLHQYVDRIVTFSDRSELLGIKTLRTQNGVDVTKLPLIKPPLGTDKVRFVGVANFGIRHAYDRMIDGLARYVKQTARRDIVFDMIGTGSQLPVLKERASKLELTDMVRFLGPLSGQALDQALDGAHLGISALGMHRISAETSDLKSREYCARGLPLVTANKDADFPPNMPHVKHIDADETPVDIASLRAWCHNMADKRTQVIIDLRNHAETHLTWNAKMTPVASWLSNAEEELKKP